MDVSAWMWIVPVSWVDTASHSATLIALDGTGIKAVLHLQRNQKEPLADWHTVLNLIVFMSHI